MHHPSPRHLTTSAGSKRTGRGARVVVVVVSALVPVLIVVANGATPAVAATPAAATPAAQGLPGGGISTSLPSQWLTPNDWLLRPAGTQVLTQRSPTGLAVAPDGSAAYTVSSGIFDEGIERIDASTLVPTPTLVGNLWLGVAPGSGNDVWASGGPSDAVFRFQQVGPALVDASPAGPLPAAPNHGTPALGFPGQLVLSGTTGPVKDMLFVGGNLSVPHSAIQSADPSAGPCPDGAPANDPVCAPVSVVNISNPSSPAVVHVIPVGRDAYGMAYAPLSSTLYVANWADKTNPARAGGTGTVSVVHVNADGAGKEVQVVPVGLDPTGIALSPDHRTLAVADSASDQVSLVKLDPATGAAISVSNVSVAVAPGAPKGTAPLAVAWSPHGKNLLVALAGLNAVEVLGPTGKPIPQRVTVPWQGTPATFTAPATYIPTGWYPDALAVAPAPGASGSRLYVANLKGMGSGPGINGQAEPLTGSRTEGSVSAIDLPDAKGAPGQLAKWTAVVVANDRLAPVYDPRLSQPAANACPGAALPGGGTVTSALLCAAQQHQLDPRQLHVVDILAENKTFDSYFGDMKPYFPDAQANPAYTIYPAAVTTNQHRIAQQFNLSDNFWNEGAEASVLGHSWFESAVATPYNELTWGQSYDPNSIRGNRTSGQWAGTTSGASDPNIAAQESAMDNPPQQIFDELQNPVDNPLGLTERVYSTDWNPTTAAGRADQAPASLWGQGPNPTGGGLDITEPDSDRASLFLTGQTVSHAWDAAQGPPPPTFGHEVGLCGGPSGDCSYPGASPADQSRFALSSWTTGYKSCVANGKTDAACQQSMPNFALMALPENHTYVLDVGINPLDPTPQSMVADNDNAIGQIVQGLSQSPFWKNTVVFVSEDDTQATGDHVDMHRTFLLAAGGLVRRLGPAHQVATQQGSFSSVLKTTELLLGLPPMTLFDQSAVPLADVIGNSVPANPPAYTAVRPLTPFFGSPPIWPNTPTVPPTSGTSLSTAPMGTG